LPCFDVSMLEAIFGATSSLCFGFLI